MGDNSNEKTTRVLFLSLQSDNTGEILDCIYFAGLIRNNHPNQNFDLQAMVHPNIYELAVQSNMFDTVQTAGALSEAKKEIKEKLKEIKPDYLFFLVQDALSDIFGISFGYTCLSPCNKEKKLKPPWIYNILNRKTLIKLKKKGLNLFQRKLNYLPKFHLESPVKGRYIYISLFDSFYNEGGWSAGHTSRFSRMLEKYEKKLLTVLALPEKVSNAMQRDVDYLLSSSANIKVLYNTNPQTRLALMTGALAVIGPAGPETQLASLAGKPTAMLFNIRTTTYIADFEAFLSKGNYDGPQGTKSLVSLSRLHLVPFTLPSSNTIRLEPLAEDCEDNCLICHNSSCLEFISPETVFHSIKKYLS